MNFPTKKIIRYLLWIAGSIIALFIILYLGLIWYVSANKTSLIGKAGTEMSKLTGGKVTIADMSVSAFNNFPYLSIALKKVDVRDSLYSTHGHRFFYAEKIFLRINPLKLVIADISVNKLEMDSGSIYLFTDSNGYSNSYLLNNKKPKPAEKKNTTTNNLLDRIEIRRTSITIDDHPNNKLFDFYITKLDVKTSASGTGYDFRVSESLLVRSLSFKRSIGSYLANHTVEGNYTVHYSAAKEELSFDSIPISLSKQPFHFTGVFSFGKVQQFSLRADTKQVTLDFAKSLLTAKTAKGIGLVTAKAPLDVSATLIGGLAGGEPLITAKWKTSGNILTTPLLDFSNCSFSGLYTNEVNKDSLRNDPNSKVEVYDFTGDWRGLTMVSDTIVISNLTTPMLAAHMRSQFKLPQFNSILRTEAMALTAGDGTLDIRYKGPIDDITTQNASLNGLLRIRNGNILMHASQSNLSSCNASIRFENADMIIDSLACRIQNDPLLVSGIARNALALVGNAPGNISLALNISAPVINIGNLSSILYRKLPAKKRTTVAKAGSLAKTTQQIDDLLSSGQINVTLNAGRLIYHKFTAQKATAEIAINENSWTLTKAALLHGAGSILVTGKVTEQANSRFGLNANLQMKNVDARKVWYEFENFGIPALNYQNIKGILSANATVGLLLDRSGNFDMSTLNGEVDFSLKKGALINFKPLQDVQTFVLKNRDFTDISFAEIKDKISFSEGIITINRMEINSSVLSLFVEGIYGINGNTDISIQLPVSNLKKRNKDYKPENSGADRGGGISVFLRAKTAEDGTIKIKYDPFKRFRKTAVKEKK